ncbi:hypothetical protein Q31b_40130 [Novipirellula aureliae]|uniref:DUF11 domain-containing protein n=2 Tax=Novipirellula aureliae TaxID=2527966 RepID=A0A5C6DRT5_9BACT|nr:hypothetical protein Q31b_40130 [Novipirellula aureliae]
MARSPEPTSRAKTASRLSRRRRLLVEQLEDRRVLAAAIDLASIQGQVFKDITGNGYNAGEEVSGANVSLYRDNGDGVFDSGTDTLATDVSSGTDGRYQFSRLDAGSYFVVQPAQSVDGRTLLEAVSNRIDISTDAVQGIIVDKIDSFDETEQVVRDTTNDGIPVTSSVVTAAGETIGGERDLFVNKTSVNGSVQLSVDNPLLPDRLTFDSDLNGDGERRVSWDGLDGDATVIDDTGLEGIDLTRGGTALGVRLQVGAFFGGGTATIRFYSDDGDDTTASRFSTATLAIPETGGEPTAAEFIEFSTLQAGDGGGGAADMTSIGAIELDISGTINANGSAELVGSIGPTVFTQDFVNFQSANLSLSKTVSVANPTVGQNVTFNLTVDNAGPDSATGVQVTDLLPPEFAFVSSNPTAAYNSTTGVWTVPSIPSTGSQSLSIVATVVSADANGNAAEITASDQFDPNSTPNNGANDEDDYATITVSPQTVDIVLTKTIDNAAPNVGDTVTFVVTVVNLGPSAATGVSVHDLLPAGLSFDTNAPSQGVVTSQGMYDRASGIWEVGTVEVGEANAETLTMVATVTAAGERSNVAEVITIDQTDTTSTPGNGDPDEDDQASVVFNTPVVDLSITKTVTNPTPNVGENFSFVIRLDNQNASTATGVRVTDIIQTPIEVISSSTNDGTVYDPSTGVWEVGNVAVDENPELTIIARINSPTPVTNTARISAVDQADADTADDSATVSVTPKSIDLSLTKSVDNARPVAGETVVFTVDVANAGPSDATGVVVADTLPAGLTLVSADTTTASGAATTAEYIPASGRWMVGTVTPTEIQRLILTATYNATSQVTNTAEVIAANEFDVDSQPNNDIPGQDDQDSVVLSPATADLSLTKTVDNGVPNVNQSVVFTIVVSNGNNDPASGVVVRDLLPSGLEFVGITPDTADYDALSGVWTIGDLDANSSATLQIEAIPRSNQLFNNVAEIIEADQFDPDSQVNNGDLDEDDQDEVQIQPQQIDLSLTKTIDKERPNVGEEVEFLLTVSNAGPSDATGVFVTDSFPAGVELVSATPGQGGSFNTTSGQWNVGVVRANQSATLTLIGRITDVGSYTNSAEVTAANQFDINSTPSNNDPDENDQASVDFRVPVADLSILKTVSNANANVGETVVFRVELTNDGPDAATDVVVTDILPLGTSFDGVSFGAGEYDATTGIWDVGTVPADSMVTLNISAIVDSIGEKVNVARVTRVNEFDPDSIPGNNDLSEDDQDQAIVTPPMIDLSLEKTVDVTRPTLGQHVEFELTIHNADRSNATGVIVTDALPDGLRFVSSVPAGPAYDPVTGQWQVGELDANASKTLQIVAEVTSVVAATNLAEVTAADQTDFDSTPDNANTAPNEDDTASATITPASADLSLTKSVDNPIPNRGSDVTFTLNVANAGPDTASDIVVADPLPGNLSFVRITPDTALYDESTGRWTIPTIASGQSASLQITATVNAAVEITNTAEIVQSNQFDPDSTPNNQDADEDDQASVTLSPQLVDLALSKIIDEPRPNVGDAIEYTLTVSNSGPSPATGVEVTDRLPSNVLFDSSRPSQGAYNSATGLWTVGNIPLDVTPTLVIRGFVQSTSGETNTAEISASDQPDSDSTPGNDIAGEDDQASVAFVTRSADLSLSQTVEPQTPDQGDQVTFTIRVDNSGPDTATGVVVTDRLPTGLNFISASPSDDYDAVSGRWNVGEIRKDGQAVLTIVAELTSMNAATNQASITASDVFDPDSTPGVDHPTDDDMASVTVTPNLVDVSVSTTVDNDAPLEGDSIEIAITVANAGPATATGVDVRAFIPDGLTIQNVELDQGSYDPVTGIWSVGTIAKDAMPRLLVTAIVDTQGVKQINVEVIATDQFDVDSDPDNNVEDEDDQEELVIRAPRILGKRLFLAR